MLVLILLMRGVLFLLTREGQGSGERFWVGFFSGSIWLRRETFKEGKGREGESLIVICGEDNFTKESLCIPVFFIP